MTLPQGWAWTTLGEIAQLIGGGTPSREVPQYFSGNIVWLTPTEIPKDRIVVISDSKERITEAALQKSSARYDRQFLCLTLLEEHILSWAIRRAKVTAGQFNLTLEICRDLPLPLPPLAEQRRIVAEVERRLSVMQEVEGVIAANLARAERLR